MVLNVGLNFILIPTMKANGAALASLTTQGFNSLAQIWIVRRMFGMKIHFMELAKFFGFGLFCLAGFWFLSEVGKVYWLLKAVLLGGLGFLLAFGMGLISIKGVFRLFKS